MIRNTMMSAVILTFYVVSANAGESSVKGEMKLEAGSRGAIINAASVSDSDATIGSVTVSNHSSLEGNVTSQTYGTAVVLNAATGAAATARLASVEVSDSSILTGNVSTRAGGAAVMNLASGINANASIGSVIVK